MAVRFQLPRIYPITDTRISGISHVEQVEKLIQGGATLIQLRDKSASSSSFYETALAAVRVARENDVRLLINDRVDIALAVGADGVHLGQNDLPVEAARELLGEQAIVGLSTHSLSQAVHAKSLPIDYLAVGPIFSTSTKDRPDPVVGTELLRTVRSALGAVNIVAIGGINEENYRRVLDAGANSVAIVSALLEGSTAIEERMRFFRSEGPQGV